MREHVANGTYGIVDYVSYPLGMLLVAPIVMRHLGSSGYGLWMITTAIVSAGGIIASGFGDANIQRVAQLRGVGDRRAMALTVSSMLGINLVLGCMLTITVWSVAPFAARHIAVSSTASVNECLVCLRIASVLILVRAVESVGTSTQRAFENYRSSVQISSGVQLLTLTSAALLALAGLHVASLLVATGASLVLGACLQLRQVRKSLGGVSLRPAFEPEETRRLLGGGVFLWLQAIGGVAFNQFDRILLGISLGAVAVAPYALCIQLAHPIFGVCASGLNFLFPYLSARAGNVSTDELRRTVLKAFLCNALLVGGGAMLLLLFGQQLLRVWVGDAVARGGERLLPPIVIGSALAGLSVTGTYAMQALGRFRITALINLGGRTVMFFLMIYLLHHAGIRGLAMSRVYYGGIALLVYMPLLSLFKTAKQRKLQLEGMPLAVSLHGGSKL
jgi:O-antigen/teichoic acid export membrane protein